MKELSIEQKAKAYDEAVKEASIAYKDEDSHLKATLERIFPELKESEGEKIRKWLITQLKLKSDVNNSRDLELMILKSITWLEKQGEKKSKKVSIWKHWKNGIAGNGEGKQVFLTKIGHTYKLSSCLSGECDYIELSELDNLLLEKQSEQKPTDKVEPNFHEGDFIVAPYCRGKIIALTSDAYLLDTGQGISFSCEYNVHLWTIEDAKNGDVLASKDGADIVIFRNFDSNTNFSSYYNIKRKGELGWSNNRFIPATKEQRATLFAKMKEAGYEWDAEKKELKKIEDEPENYKKQVMSEITDLVEDYIRQKPVKWNEEDEKILQWIIFDIKRLINDNKKANVIANKELDWLKSLKERIGG